MIGQCKTFPRCLDNHVGATMYAWPPGRLRLGSCALGRVLASTSWGLGSASSTGSCRPGLTNRRAAECTSSRPRGARGHPSKLCRDGPCLRARGRSIRSTGRDNGPDPRMISVARYGHMKWDHPDPSARPLPSQDRGAFVRSFVRLFLLPHLLTTVVP